MGKKRANKKERLSRARQAYIPENSLSGMIARVGSRPRSPVPSAGRKSVPRGKMISVRARVGGDRIVLHNPESRLTIMKSMFHHTTLPRARVQLGERIILAAFQVGRFTNRGRISENVLSGQTFGKTEPLFYARCMEELVRKGKIARQGKDWVRIDPEKTNARTKIQRA
jgi:hypothetical protein